MKGYILRWNPAISSWKTAYHQNCMAMLSGGSGACFDWSIFDYHDLKDGDFFILQQVGTEYDGIAAVGTFTSDPYTDKSWKKKDGSLLHYADVTCSFMINRDRPDLILSARELEKQFPEIDWHKGHSGVLIPNRVLEPLVLEIGVTLFNQKVQTLSYAFENKTELYYSLSHYINTFCPDFRAALIKQKSLVYEKYDKTEKITDNMVTIGFDKEKIEECRPITKDNLHEFLAPLA